MYLVVYTCDMAKYPSMKPPFYPLRHTVLPYELAQHYPNMLIQEDKTVPLGELGSDRPLGPLPSNIAAADHVVLILLPAVSTEPNAEKLPTEILKPALLAQTHASRPQAKDTTRATCAYSSTTLETQLPHLLSLQNLSHFFACFFVAPILDLSYIRSI